MGSLNLMSGKERLGRALYILFCFNVLLSMEPWAAAKKLSVSVAVPPSPVWVPCQWPLAPSVASVTSVANCFNVCFACVFF